MQQQAALGPGGGGGWTWDYSGGGCRVQGAGGLSNIVHSQRHTALTTHRQYYKYHQATVTSIVLGKYLNSEGGRSTVPRYQCQCGGEGCAGGGAGDTSPGRVTTAAPPHRSQG